MAVEAVCPESGCPHVCQQQPFTHVLGRFTHVGCDAYIRTSYPKHGIDKSAELDLDADPHDLTQKLKPVRDLNLNLRDIIALRMLPALNVSPDPPWDPSQCFVGVLQQGKLPKEVKDNHGMRPYHNR